MEIKLLCKKEIKGNLTVGKEYILDTSQWTIEPSCVMDKYNLLYFKIEGDKYLEPIAQHQLINYFDIKEKQ